MYADKASPQTPLVEQAGTLDFHSLNQQSISNPNSSHAGETALCEIPKALGAPGEEQALEWHEVIELQAFSERKAWIEHKIKLLEQMPPIEVFAGLDAVRRSAEEVTGLPSRKELEQWLQEHDRIERDTEIFDSGEMTNLRKFTKAATQRNLSPADTDLIELTLTTIYELDKLLHLLRDRSDNLELLGIRLTWEERRISAWRELRRILADLQHFLDTRGRWSPSIYDSPLSEDEEQNTAPEPPKDYPSQIMTHTLKRKGSIVSLASSTTESIVSSLVLSRSERFKLAERLSRDAAHFASRVSFLKHNKISATGKALDQLIDASRKPVPDELLDEQDKLEDEGINGTEDVGKFVMGVIMQWKKADETYVETVKDKNTAQTLLEEIETAKLFHPTSRQDAAFLARIATLSKRLAMRMDPSAPNSSFPQPYHPLFESQETSNAVTAETLSKELASAWEHARKAEAAAKEYRANYEAVKKVETVCKTAQNVSLKLESILQRLQRGSDDDAGEGVPPDLVDESCLRPSRHSVFLSLLPSLVNELRQVDADSIEVLHSARLALLDVGCPGVDPGFISQSVATIDRLDELRVACSRTRDIILGRASTLKRVREIWTKMANVLEELDGVRSGVLDAIRLHRWKSQAEDDAALLTPESPTSILPAPDLSPVDTTTQLDSLRIRLQREISSPLDDISSSLGSDLGYYLGQCSSALEIALADAKRLLGLWESIRKQAEGMRFLQDQAYALQLRSEDLKLRYENAVQDALSEETAETSLESALVDELQQLRVEINDFLSDLPKRVAFVSRERSTAHTSLGLRRRFSVSGFSLEILQQATTTDLPIDLMSLDRAVRTDVNSYSIALAGALDGLDRKVDLLRLANLARNADAKFETPIDYLQKANEATVALQSALDDLREGSITLEMLSALSDQIDWLYPQYGPTILASLSSQQGLLDQLRDSLSRHEPTTTRRILESRIGRIDELRQQFEAWKESVEVLSERISDMRHLEQVRLAETERQQREEEARQRAEEERLARSARDRIEQERVKAERSKEAASVELLHNLLSDEDVFVEQSLSQDSPMSGELSDLQTHVRALRKRLSAIGIDDLAQAAAPISANLPATHQAEKLDKHLSVIVDEVSSLPPSVAEFASIDNELSSLRAEVIVSSQSITRIKQLARLASSAQHCDDALSDLLEHVDSFPAPPAGPLASLYPSDLFMPPEEQLSSRLSFTRGLVHDLIGQCAELVDDTRVISERDRVLRTWDELQAMALDRLDGQKSRPPSVLSSGRSSRASIISVASSSGASIKPPAPARREDSKPAGQFLAPPPQRTRRVTSTASVNGHSRPSSRASVSTKRSVSGPIDRTPIASRLQTTTYASRQRSASVTSTSSPLATPMAKRPIIQTPLAPPATITRPRAQTAQSRRAASPAFSESSNVSRSRSSLHMSQSSTSRSTWSRAPRPSFPTLPMASPPRRCQRVTQSKPYIPNPKNKLDVALGDVVNSLPVDINIEVVEDTWRDQSGKYWIGGEDSKLCFCRILRSQTVMVRVGGGWTELSKFIREHFADAFRLLPESPPRAKSSEEKWISSVSLAQTMQSQESKNLTSPPRTPEPKSPRSIPSFALSTSSPPSVVSSPGSPLRAIQYIRRADRESPIFRPDTPTKSSRAGIPSNAQRQPAWRP